MSRLLVVCVVALLAVGASAEWKDLFGFPWSTVPLELATTIACPNSSLCYIAGSHGNDPFAVYLAPTAQNFQNVTMANNVGHSLMIMSMAAMGTTGVTAGIGALKDPGVLYTTDGSDWQPSNDIALTEGQDVEVIDSQTYAFIGETNVLLNEQGVLLTQDGGATWKAHDWKNSLNLPDGVSARYGSFPSLTTWYVSAGTWPGNNSVSHVKSLSATRHFDRKTKKYMRGFLNSTTGKTSRTLEASTAPAPSTNGYYAAMTKTTDGGATWNVQYTNSGAFYFNDVHCASETVCIAVAEGFSDGTSPGARIFVTTDGTNWNQKYIVTEINTSFMWVRMTSLTEAWVGGSYAKSELQTAAIFYSSSDAGETWTAGKDIKGSEEVMSMWFVSPSQGYATAITELDVCTVLAYTP
jgi:hypothetical protein